MKSIFTVSLIVAGIMFSGCRSLAGLDASGFDTANVTNMSGMFSGCSSLKSLDLSNWNAHKVRDMADMFKGCYQLTDFKCSGTEEQNLGNSTFVYVVVGHCLCGG